MQQGATAAGFLDVQNAGSCAVVAIWQRFRAVGETLSLLHLRVTGHDENTRLSYNNTN
jgi:hypothetical protein